MIGYFAGLRLHGDAIALNKAAYLAIGRLLLGSGLDPNAADLLTGETAIFDAIRCNDKDMVALLLNYVSLSISISISRAAAAADNFCAASLSVSSHCLAGERSPAETAN